MNISLSRLRELLGEPLDEARQVGDKTCVYYDAVESDDPLEQFQFCFVAKKLAVVSSYHVSSTSKGPES